MAENVSKESYFEVASGKKSATPGAKTIQEQSRTRRETSIAMIENKKK